jgi:hypothetical protein
MNCYVCATSGVAAAAVATCRHCSCGLCLDHLRIAAADPARGGTHATCDHDTWRVRATPRAADRSSTVGAT